MTLYEKNGKYYLGLYSDLDYSDGNPLNLRVASINKDRIGLLVAMVRYSLVICLLTLPPAIWFGPVRYFVNADVDFSVLGALVTLIASTFLLVCLLFFINRSPVRSTDMRGAKIALDKSKLFYGYLALVGLNIMLIFAGIPWEGGIKGDQASLLLAFFLGFIGAAHRYLALVYSKSKDEYEN